MNILLVITDAKFLNTQKKEYCIHIITALNHRLAMSFCGNQPPQAAHRPLHKDNKYCEMEGMSKIFACYQFSLLN